MAFGSPIDEKALVASVSQAFHSISFEYVYVENANYVELMFFSGIDI
jgi:hypothetical protein